MSGSLLLRLPDHYFEVFCPLHYHSSNSWLVVASGSEQGWRSMLRRPTSGILSVNVTERVSASSVQVFRGVLALSEKLKEPNMTEVAGYSHRHPSHLGPLGTPSSETWQG